MHRALAVFRSTVGLKFAMAVSGLIFVAFVIGHMVGNLKAFQGPEAFNHYAVGLRTLGDPVLGYGQALWIVRIVLFLALVTHVVTAAILTRRSWAARPVAYRKTPSLELSYASRTMRWGGVILLLFIIYHILHLTTGTAHPDFIEGDAFHNLVVGFGSPWVVAAYVVAQLALAAHIYHGTWSAFQSLGVLREDRAAGPRMAALAVAAVVLFGFLAVPLAIQAGVIG